MKEIHITFMKIASQINYKSVHRKIVRNSVASTSEHKSFMLWKFALYTGLRACEVTALKWDCVFMNLHSGGHTGFILVKRSRAQKATVVSEKTKNGEKRMIPLSPEVKEILLSLEKNKSSGDFVFGGELSIDTSHWSRDLKKEIKKYPTLPMVTYHELRHSFCSYLDATGMPRRIVAAIMGHKDLNTTNRYSHVNDQMIGSEFGRWLEQQVQKNQKNCNKVGVI